MPEFDQQLSLRLGELTGTVKALVDNTNMRFAEREQASAARHQETAKQIEKLTKETAESVDKLASSVSKLAGTVGNLRVSHAKQAGGIGAMSAVGVILLKFLLDKGGVHF